MPSITEVALEIALTQLHVREEGGNNRGRQVEEYLASVRLLPGEPWCCAGMFWCFERAARRLQIPNPFPRTGSGIRLWDLSDRVCRDSNPRPGYVYVLDHGDHKSHVGIVRNLSELGDVDEEVSFNTNAAGSREGNQVAIHHGTPEVSHGGQLLGYLDFARAFQALVT